MKCSRPCHAQFPVLYGFDKHSTSTSEQGEAILTTEQFCVALMPGASAPIRKRRKDRKERAEAAALAAATNPGRQRRRSVVESITAMASGLFSTSTDGDPASQQGGRRKSFLATMLGTNDGRSQDQGGAGSANGRRSFIAAAKEGLVGRAPSNELQSKVVV
jgi:hypothetical protein